MPEPYDPDPASGTPEGPEQEAVRRLLREARHDEPVPADVAARLDRALAGLAREPGAPDGPEPGSEPEPPHDELAARRRRRTAVALLVAAAAVVVAGVGVGRLLDRSPSVESAGSSSAADRDTAREEDAEPSASEGPPQAGADADGAGPSTQERRGSLPLAGDPPTVREQHFTRDVRAVRRAAARVGLVSGAGPDAAPAPDRTPFSCPPGDWGPGMPVAVEYRGAPAVLVFRRTTGDTQVADLLACGSAEPLRSVTLTGP